MKRFRLIRTTVFRLAILHAGVFSLVSAVILGLIYWSTVAQVNAQIDTGLNAEKDALVSLFRVQGLDSLIIAVAQRSHSRNHTANAIGNSGPRHYLLSDANHHKLAGDLKARPKGVHSSSKWTTLNINHALVAPGALAKQRHHRVRAVTATLGNGDHLLIGQSLDEADELANHILYLTLLAIGLSFFLAVLGGALMGRSVLKRIDAVNAAADEIIVNGNLSRRIATSRRDDEFSELDARLNAMLSRIEELLRNIREVSENIAHDLRGPLSRLRSRLEIILLEPREDVDYREALAHTVSDTEALLKTFNAVLSIAQLDAGVQRGRWDEIDLGQVAADAAELYRAGARERRIEFNCTAEPHATVRGNRQLLSQAVGSLLDNAIKYTPTGGRVALDVTRDKRSVFLRVRDSGPGIPAEERAHVLERFVRLDTSRSQTGNGLGLSLVRAVANAHGGQLSLKDNAPGLLLVLEFPEFEPYLEE